MSDLLLAALLLAAPVPKDKGGFYFPTKVGARCEYDGGKEKVPARTVTKVEPAAGGGFVVTVALEGEDKPDQLRVTDKGLFVLSVGGERQARQHCLLKLPAVPGETWEEQERGMAAKLTTVGPERVEVPAGKFDAVRVDMTGEVAGRRVTTSAWYAPGVGPVKMVEGGRTVLALKKFIPGKD